MRVPTPSVASEVAVFDYKKTYDRLIDLNNLYYKNLTNRLSAYKEDFLNQAENISKSVKLRLVETKSKTIKNIKDIENNFQVRFQSEKHKLEKMIEILSKLNPLEILKNGYAFIEKDNKKVVSAKAIEVGDEISVSFSDGKVSAVVNKKEN